MTSILPIPVEFTCPHCKKSGTSGLMAGRTERHTGFKCPHCRLFVPISRVELA